MMDLAHSGLSLGLMMSALFFGLRHGIDWDHIAAITDIAATQESPRQGFRLGTIYVLGHAAVVLTLGLVVISLGSTIPPWLDATMGQVVGWTLLLMGAYVIFSLVRDRGRFRMRSRWMLLFAGLRRVRLFVTTMISPSPIAVTHDHAHAAVDGIHHTGGAGNTGEAGAPAAAGSRIKAPTHRHPHTHDLDDADLGTATVAGIGMLHGIGAETPTQLIVFLAAANAGGMGTGIAVLAVFIVGLVISNSAITLASTLSFRARSVTFHRVLGGVTAALSIVVGTLFVFGADGSLPVWFAG
jgi:high-affinity nickel-transport protein